MGAFIENNPTIIFLTLSAIVGIAYWAGSTHKSVKTLEGFMKEVRDDIKEILRKFPSLTVTRSSPLQLTDLGREISEKLKASDWANQTAPHLVASVVGKHPYEIQEFCLEYVASKESTISQEMNEKIKTCAFENGIGKDEVLKVLAVILRDVLLKDDDVISSSPVPPLVDPPQ